MNMYPPILTERCYQLPIHRVWDLVTNQQYLTQWLMPGNFKPEVGHEYFFECYPADDVCDGKVFGEILEVNKPFEVKFTWITPELETKTVVCFRLKETERGTLFHIEHSGFAEKDKNEHDKHTRGWDHHLALLEKTPQHEGA